MNLRCRISANAWEKKPLFSQVVYKAIKVSKALPHRTKKTKAGKSLKLNAYLFFILICVPYKWRYIEGCRISFYSSEYLFRYFFYYYYLSLYLYVRNFQTGPLDAWLSYLKNLISYVIVKDMCLQWLDKLTLVNGLKSYGVSTDSKQSSKQIVSRRGWLCYGMINVEWDRALFV